MRDEEISTRRKDETSSHSQTCRTPVSPELLRFHHSHVFLPVFDPRAAQRPFFTWFGDRFYELTAIGSPYVYVFLVNPCRDNVRFDRRPYHGGFHGLYATCLQRRTEFED